jgi:hypothetical protein
MERRGGAGLARTPIAARLLLNAQKSLPKAIRLARPAKKRLYILRE